MIDIARHDPDLHWVQIKQSSYSQIHYLIKSGAMRPYAAPLSGPRNAQVWQVTTSKIDIQSDHHLSIAGVSLNAALLHQPSHVYAAMVSAAPQFMQYEGSDHLYRQLRTPLNWDPQRFATNLEGTVRQGRTARSSPLLTSVPTTYVARWLQNQMFVAQLSNEHYMLGLSYSVSYRPPPSVSRRVAVGLDLGIDPLTVAYTDAGETVTFRPTPLGHLRQLPPLSPDAQVLLEDLVYASGRADAERIVAWLNHCAHTVYAERLQHQGMTSHWIHRGRDLAIHDHHYSALSQYLNTSGVEFRRVAAHHTSTICARCWARRGRIIQGVRSGPGFRCTACGCACDAHANAAHNVLLRGRQLPPRRRAA